MKLTNIMVNSENSKKLAEFYTKLLGEPGWTDGKEWFGYGGPDFGIMICPHSEVKGASTNPERIIIGYSTDDVSGEFERIKTLGAKVIAEPYQPSKVDSPDMWLATFADTDGNFFQLSTPWKT